MREGGKAEGRPTQARSSTEQAAQDEGDFTGEISSWGTFSACALRWGPENWNHLKVNKHDSWEKSEHLSKYS